VIETPSSNDEGCMSNSIERVEQWGEALAELSNALEKRQMEIAEEEVAEVPKGFEELESLAGSITPKSIAKKAIEHIESHGELIKHVLPAYGKCYHYYWAHRNLNKAFMMSSIEKLNFWFNQKCEFSSHKKIYLPILRELFYELENFDFKPLFKVFYNSASIQFYLIIRCPKY
jgi:hypothetical protein